MLLTLFTIAVLIGGGFTLGVAVCCTYTGMTPRELGDAIATTARRIRREIGSDAPSPGRRVDDALAHAHIDGHPFAGGAFLSARSPQAPAVDDPPAPTLDDLADDLADDPICAAVLAGTALDLKAHPHSCRQVVQHLQTHGRSYQDALTDAAAILSVRPVALDKILNNAYQRPTTDAELDLDLLCARIGMVLAPPTPTAVDEVNAPGAQFLHHVEGGLF